LIGVVARLAPEKGIAYLLEAAGEVLKKRPGARFAIVGDGPERESLEAQARMLGVSERVRFMGKRRDMPGVYASLDVLVQPSVDEGLPITLLEAQASRVAVVATRVGAVPRVIEEGTTGLLVEAKDAAALARAMLRVLESRELRERIAAGGYERVARQFSAERMTREYVEEYESALSVIRGKEAYASTAR
jgi:glycosyltransferase involved in cell wall biosynthesis